MSPVVAVTARELGARGSRTDLSAASGTTHLPAHAGLVLAAVPAWWRARAKTAGLSGRWLDVEHAVAAPVPELPSPGSSPAVAVDATAEELGMAYTAALSPAVRARHGRHYTPTPLAERLWQMTRAAMGHTAPARRLAGLVRDPACGAGALLLPALTEH